MKEKIAETWRLLDKSIYVGERLKANLLALSAVSIATIVLSMILMVDNFRNHRTMMLIASVVTFLASISCLYFALVRKNRKIAILFPTLFSGAAFTIYTLTGFGQGTPLLWSILLPIGISYFVSVKSGIVLSAYYMIFFGIVFYTPLRDMISVYYSEPVMQRIPLLFDFTAIFCIIAMIQYHRTALFEIEHTNQLNKEVAEQTKVARDRADKLEKLSEEMVETLARTIDAKDKYTNGHSFRVSEYAVALARKLDWDEESIRRLRREGLLHDIGKIGVPDAVLNKPGRLTDDEFAIIKSHTDIGGDILAKSAELTGASDTARYHHERYDGKGYPKGLSGKQIPLNARLVSIADSFDAMHSDRIYRKGLPKDLIRQELIKGCGSQFDPELLPVFLEMFENDELEDI